MALTRKKALWLASESTYSTDPSADGSGYLSIPALSIGEITDEKEILQTGYQTGRPYPTAPIVGMDGASLTFEIPLIGLAADASDGETASSSDWLHLILAHLMGLSRTTTGEGLASVPDSTGFVTESTDFTAQDLVPIFESGVPSGGVRSQWVLVTAANAAHDHDSSPAFSSNPTGAAIAYGAVIYSPDDDGGSTLSAVVQEDELKYTLTGGRVTSFSITAEAGKMVRASVSMKFDDRTEDTSGKSALPVYLAAPANTPVVGLLSPAWFGGTGYPCRSISIDFGLETAEVMATAQSNGRSNIQNVSMRPTITINPLRTNVILDLKRNGTVGRCLVQLGAGVVSGGVLNSLCLCIEQATAEEVTLQDDAGILRQGVKIVANDKVYFTGSTLSKYFQVARA